MDVSEIVKQLGGTNATAKMFRIKPPSVSEWIRNNQIPEARLMYLQAVRPELFRDDDKSAA